MEKYDRFIMSVIVYARVCFTYITYIIMVYVGRDVARITAIGRIIIILYYAPGVGLIVGDTGVGGSYCRRNRKTMFDRKRPPAFSTSANKYTRFQLVVFKGRGGGIVLGEIYTERSLAAVVQFNCVHYIFIDVFIMRIIILHTVKPMLMDTSTISTHS